MNPVFPSCFQVSKYLSLSFRDDSHAGAPQLLEGVGRVGVSCTGVVCENKTVAWACLTTVTVPAHAGALKTYSILFSMRFVGYPASSPCHRLSRAQSRQVTAADRSIRVNLCEFIFIAFVVFLGRGTVPSKGHTTMTPCRF